MLTMTTQEEADKTIEMVRRLYAEAMGHDDIMVSNNVVFEWFFTYKNYHLPLNIKFLPLQFKSNTN